MIHFPLLHKNNIIDILRSFERGGFGYGYASYDACADALIKDITASGFRHEQSVKRKLMRKKLTKRQADVLKLKSSGKTNAMIAKRLGITKRGVEWHISNIYIFSGCRTSAQLLLFSIKYFKEIH